MEIKCACGCNKVLNKYDSRGRTRRFLHGHNRKFPKGEQNPSYKRGKTIHSNGSYKYYKVLAPKHPFCDKKGYVFEHRLIMEKHIGRYMDKQEVVHHIDKNGLNNNIDNLILLPNSAAHSALHRKLEKLEGRPGNGR